MMYLALTTTVFFACLACTSPSVTSAPCVVDAASDASRSSIAPDHVELGKSIDTYLDDLETKDEFSGAVLVAKNGKPVYERAVGLAHKGFGVRNRIDTKFIMGSMGKMFTGVAIAILDQQGKLSFQDTVGKFLNDYPNAEIRDKATIHQLLTHTSGLGDYFGDYFERAHFNLTATTEDFAKLCKDKPLLFSPGADYRYSNCGPFVLGLIIEKISGVSYEEFIRKNIFIPAGMNDTGLYDAEVPTPNLAMGYTKQDAFSNATFATWRANTFMNAAHGCASGGAYTTVGDLLKFDQALRTYQLLDKAHFETVTAGYVDMLLTTEDGGVTPLANYRYGYAFIVNKVNNRTRVGHSGLITGASGNLDMIIESGYTTVVLANYGSIALSVAGKLGSLVP